MSRPHQVVSLSGGKDSTAMLLMMLERGEPVHSAVFFDTGWEFPQMHDHIALVERMIAPVPVVRLEPRRPFLENMMYRPVRPRGKKNAPPRFLGWGWPSPLRRWCTREKAETIARYIRDIGGGVSCIGYAAEESKRTKTKNMIKRGDAVRFPLIEWNITEPQALTYCRKRGFDWGGLYDHFRRVSCFCCPLQGVKELRKLRHHYPEQWALMLKWDREMPDNRGFRDYTTVQDFEVRFAEEDRQCRLPLEASG